MKMNFGIFLLLLFTSSFIQYSYSLTGFECGGEKLNITAFSLLDVGQCEIPKLRPKVTETYIQLVQLSQYTFATVKQCKVSISRHISTCGTFSHTRMAENAHIDYLREISRKDCLKLHTKNNIYINEKYTFSDAEVNKTISKQAILAGKLDGDSCTGGSYTDFTKQYKNVVVQAQIDVTLKEFTAAVNLEADKIILPSGYTCKLSRGECLDTEDGTAFWDIAPSKSCNFDNYDVLYEGYANKTNDDSYRDAKPMYTVKNNFTLFAITQIDRLDVCDQILRKTDYEKLFIIETKSDRPIVKRKKIAAQNVNLINYVNAKFVYTENHIHEQLDQLYEDVLRQRCELEQKVLKNTLMFATLSPTDFAMELAKERGYTSVVMGEVVYLIKCLPVEVRVQRLKECYQQLPVLRGNTTYFLSPRTHILLKKGTQIDCHPILPPMYYLENKWFSITPRLTLSVTPEILKTTTRSTWDYIPAGNLATMGIYTEKEMKDLRNHIMFPVEKAAVLNSIVRGMSGQGVVHQDGFSVSNMLDEVSIKKIVDKAWNSVWGTFTTFGTASAGLIGIYFMIRLVKVIIDTVIRVYQLQDVFGWSFHILLAIWDSLTVLVLHLASSRDEKPPPTAPEHTEKEEKIEMQENAPVPATRYTLCPQPAPVFYVTHNEGTYPQMAQTHTTPESSPQYHTKPSRKNYPAPQPNNSKNNSHDVNSIIPNPNENTTTNEKTTTSEDSDSTRNNKEANFRYPIERPKK